MLCDVGGPIPCESCCGNIVTGTVYKIRDKIFICEDCYNDSIEMYTSEENGLDQFEEEEL